MTPLVLADDLSGAAETAAALGAAAQPELVLWPDLPDTPTRRPVVFDLDSRHLPAPDAAARVATALRAVPDAAPVFKKIDSLLRGNVAAEVGPLLAPHTLVVFTPALPHQGRTVTDGVLHDRGVPLNRTELWALEPMPAPDSVAAALPGLPVRTLDLATVRGPGLSTALADAVGTLAVCDAATHDDLAALVAAGLAADPGVRFVGSSDLARALGRRLTTLTPDADTRPEPAASGSVLHVLGTGSAAALRQADLLAAQVAMVRRVLAPHDLAALDANAATQQGGALASDLAGGSVIVQVGAAPDPDLDGAAIVAGLARLVAATLVASPGWPVRLMLTGGQTARAVLEELHCRRLAVRAEIHPGAVLLTTETGGLIATRPGSHGGPDSLIRIHRALATSHPNHPHANRIPPNQEDS